MASVATRDPASALAGQEAGGRAAERVAQRLFESGGPTLEEWILATWDELAAGRRADCPVCGGAMSPAAGCTACGSDLS